MADTNTTDTVSAAAAAASDELGVLLSYAALGIMAVVPIYMGAKRSVKDARKQDDEVEVMTAKDAYMFPVYASGALFGLYTLFYLFGKEYVNLVLGAYFFVLGVLSVATSLRPLTQALCPRSFTAHVYKVNFSKEDAAEGANHHTLWKTAFDKVDLVSLALAAAFGVWYLHEKHWVANNIFGLSFAVSGVALLSLGSFKIGCTLLWGLFFYDIFWVFGTDVMVTVAKSFDAPIKVLFPKDIVENGLAAKQFAMLGLGDIVIPGFFIALLLRFDVASGFKSTPYFRASFAAYIAGLATTIFVMHTFKAAQPALLYLVPFCTLTPLLLSVVRGETSKLLAYSEEEDEAATDKKKAETAAEDVKKTN